MAASPRVDEEGNLGDVTVIAPNDAWAVGSYYGVDALQRTLAEHWDGAAWSVAPSPNASAIANELDAVSGSSSSDVWAVGQAMTSAASQYTPIPLIEHWDGKSWTVTPNPPLDQGEHLLTGIAAISPTDAWAVGYEQIASGDGVTQTPLIVHWDGSAWKVAPSPSIAGGSEPQLMAVAADGPNDVWAVGGDGGGALIEHWDGHAWTVTQDDATSAAGSGDMGMLVSVSADGPHDAWAVGSGVAPYVASCASASNNIMEHWDGQQWSSVSFPTPAPPSGGGIFGFNHVAAAAPNDVWAVGGLNTYSPNITPEAEHWDGSQWNLVALPSLAMSIGLASVTDRDGAVWMVGQAELSNGAGATVVGRWSGSQWTQAPSPSPGTLSNELNGVAAIGPNDVWAVGDSAAGALSEHWNGAQWSVIPTPNGVAQGNYLNAVAGSSATDVWAVGAGGAERFDGQGEIEHWDGSAWTLLPAPMVNGQPVSALFGAATLSASDAWAVGMSGAIHWDGHAWAVSAGAPSGLFGVAAVSPQDVWAIGGNPPLGCGGPAPATIAHWNGRQWSTIPNLPQGVLYSVSAASSSDVWAVGSGYGSPLILHWDGTQWKQIALTGVQSKLLSSPQGVVARASDDVWVVGGNEDQRQFAVLHWDGHSWTAATLTAPGQATTMLNAVAAVSASEVWAVGSYGQFYGETQALIERYSA